MKRIIMALILTVSTLAGPASAHSLWVALTESFNHPPGHVTSLVGFGHSLPIDDLLAGNYGTIALAKYDLVGPDNSRFDLGLPDLKVAPVKTSPTGMAVNTGDLGLRKIASTEKSTPGTYQVAVESKPAFFTTYIDKNGKHRMAPKSMDRIKDIKSVIASVKYEAFAKAFYAVGKWTSPEPLGNDLELMPLSDLSDVHVGDLIQFKVTYKGKPVTVSENAINRMTCVSNTFGGPDKFQLDSHLRNGIAQFRIPTAGQWLGNVYYKQAVGADPRVKDLEGKCTLVYTSATIFFTVKP